MTGDFRRKNGSGQRKKLAIIVKEKEKRTGGGRIMAKISQLARRGTKTQGWIG